MARLASRLTMALALLGAACGSHGGSGAGSGSGGLGGGGSGGGATTGGANGTAGARGAGGASPTIDLCAGLVTDKQPRPMTTLAKPALGALATDTEFGTTIRRITAVGGSGANAFIVPMYSTISAWNADESLLILYAGGGAGHQLYDGKSYAFIRPLDISPADVEQVYWDTADPDLLYYTDGEAFIRYHVSTSKGDRLHDFSSLCGSSTPTNGDDPMFTSW
ncbi:MAG TPA: hypothetical protein VGP64_07865, partial [Polyangia bacterium]